MRLLYLGLIGTSLLSGTQAAIWEFDVGGLAGSGLLGGNVVDTRADSFASGKEVTFNEVPGIIYNDESKILEFHVGWGVHEVVNGTQLAGQYVSSALYGPAEMNENAPRALYSFDSSNGYIPANDPTGRTGFIHAQVQLVDLEGYSVAQQQADLLGSRFYFSINSTAYETGEIRGQLLKTVPEPQHAALATALLLAGGAALRMRKKAQSSH